MSWTDRLHKLLLGDPVKRAEYAAAHAAAQTAAQAATARAAAARQQIVPPDSVALQLLLRQVELDAWQAGQQWAGVYSGQSGTFDVLAGNAERERRKAIARKVGRGEPVTVREVIDATTGLANTMGPGGDALRMVLALERPGAGPAA